MWDSPSVLRFKGKNNLRFRGLFRPRIHLYHQSLRPCLPSACQTYRPISKHRVRGLPGKVLGEREGAAQEPLEAVQQELLAVERLDLQESVRLVEPHRALGRLHQEALGRLHQEEAALPLGPL